MKAKCTSPTLLALLFMFLFLNSCNEKELKEVQPSSDPLSNRTEEIYPLKSVAPELYEKITEQYEDYGRLVYSHAKFNPVDDPIEYAPVHLRASLLEAWEKSQREYGGMDYRQRLDKLRAENLMDDSVHLLFVTFLDVLSQNLEAANSPIEVWKFLRQYEKELLKSKPNEAGVGNLLVVSSMLRNQIRYQWEVDEFTKRYLEANPDKKVAQSAKDIGERTGSTASDCFLGIKKSCWVTIVGNTIMDAASAGLAAGSSALKPDSDKKFWVEARRGGVIGAAISFLKNTYVAYSGSGCGCGTQTLAACAKPTGLRLVIDNCALTHKFHVIGGGTSPTSFDYIAMYGTLPATTPLSHAVYKIGDKLIEVTQTNQNTPVNLTVNVNCGNGTYYTYSNTYDLYALTRSPGTVGISGATYINYNDPSSWTYTLISGGGFAANANNSISWSRNWAGQTVEGGVANGDYIKVKWVYRTNMAKVFVSSTNACSGQQVISELAVNVY